MGDGSIVRAALQAVLDALHKVAAPTGARGSILLMSGGLIVLGFLFLAFTFRSAIVGDLAPVANAREPTRRVALPPLRAAAAPTRVSATSFQSGRNAARDLPASIDEAFEALAQRGADARILNSRADWKIVRVYACASCDQTKPGVGCEYVRGLLAGAFEAITGDAAKVHEVACRGRGEAAYCEFEVRHRALVEAR